MCREPLPGVLLCQRRGQSPGRGWSAQNSHLCLSTQYCLWSVPLGPQLGTITDFSKLSLGDNKVSKGPFFTPLRGHLPCVSVPSVTSLGAEVWLLDPARALNRSSINVR